MKLLVTGGAGYIGSVVAAELLRADHDVVVYDNLSKGHRAAVPRGAELVVADLADAVSLNAIFKLHRFDAVLHFAAFIEVGESMVAPERFFRNNAVNSLALLECVVKHQVPRFVFSSTAALYGNPERNPIAESDPLRPTSPYGESKLFVERALAWHHRIHGVRYASLRYFNAAGATAEHGEAHDPESHLIPIVLQAAAGTREHVQILGTDYPTADGTCVRDYIHVEDLAMAHRLALEKLDGADRPLIYNLGNGAGFSVKEVIETARRVTGKEIVVKEAARRPGDPAVLVSSAEKIRRELGFKAKRSSLEEMIGSAWEWRVAHPQGYSRSGD